MKCLNCLIADIFCFCDLWWFPDFVSSAIVRSEFPFTEQHSCFQQDETFPSWTLHRCVPLPRPPPLNSAFQDPTCQNALTRLCHFKGSSNCGLLFFSPPEFGGHDWCTLHCMWLWCIQTVLTDSESHKVSRRWSPANTSHETEREKSQFRIELSRPSYTVLVSGLDGLFMMLQRHTMKEKVWLFLEKLYLCILIKTLTHAL